MFRDILIYQRERSPLPFVFLLATLMFCSGMRNFDVEINEIFTGALTVSVFLLFVRLGDDIADIDIDRLTHPERALCDGRINIRRMHHFTVFMAFVMLLLQWGRTDCAGMIGLAVVLCGVFFQKKKHFNAWVNVVLLNATLMLFPVYAGLLLYGEVSLFHWLMGAFFWAGGIAHDLSHCILDEVPVGRRAINPINRIPGTLLAKVSLAMFFVSATLGAILFMSGDVGVWFALMLMVTSAFILLLEYRLIRQPCSRTAKPFYTLGFAFFLLPVVGHLVDLTLRAFS